MRPLTDLDKEAASLLLGNATDFLDGALDIIFGSNVTQQQMKIAVIAIQACFELLSKYRIVREHGIDTIIRGSIPSGNLLEASQKGMIKTITFTECLKLIQSSEPFTESEKYLIAEVQNTRNALAHFSAVIDIEDCRHSCVWLIIRALAMLAAGSDRDQGEMQNHSKFLTEDNFNRLTSYGPYRAEAVDAALDNIDSVDVYRCCECLDDAFCLRESETYFCYCCGLTVDADAIGFAKCAICNEGRGVCFDPLNDQGDEHFHGRCLHCGQTQLINEWTDFGTTHLNHNGPRGIPFKQS